MAQSKMEEFITLLHQRTLEGKIIWEETVREGVYQAAFPEYVVKMMEQQTQSPLPPAWKTGPPYRLEIIDDRGVVVEQVSINSGGIQPDPLLKSDPQVYAKLQELYEIASAGSSRGERALDTLLSRLKANG